MKIVEYDDSLAAEFRDINLEWISSMFRVAAREYDATGAVDGRVPA